MLRQLAWVTWCKNPSQDWTTKDHTAYASVTERTLLPSSCSCHIRDANWGPWGHMLSTLPVSHMVPNLSESMKNILWDEHYYCSLRQMRLTLDNDLSTSWGKTCKLLWGSTWRTWICYKKYKRWQNTWVEILNNSYISMCRCRYRL